VVLCGFGANGDDVCVKANDIILESVKNYKYLLVQELDFKMQVDYAVGKATGHM